MATEILKGREEEVFVKGISLRLDISAIPNQESQSWRNCRAGFLNIPLQAKSENNGKRYIWKNEYHNGNLWFSALWEKDSSSFWLLVAFSSNIVKKWVLSHPYIGEERQEGNNQTV